MIDKIHVIRTEDESIWIDFDGSVPRVGDSVLLSLIAEDYEINDKDAKKKWTVYKVDWLLVKWRTEPFPSPIMSTTVINQARVFIK